MRAWLLPLLALFISGCPAMLLRGCNDFDVRFVVTLPEGHAREELTLSASLFMPAQGSEVTCDNLAYGDVSVDELRVSQVAAFELEGDQGDVASIPLDGYKIVLIEANGTAADPLGGTLQAVVAAGCVELPNLKRPGPFDPTLEVEVTLEPAVWISATNERGIAAEKLSFELDVPWQDSTLTEVLRIVLLNAMMRAPPEGTQVRARVIGPSGAVASEYFYDTEVQTEMSGDPPVQKNYSFVDYAAEVHFAGAFEVELAPRWSLGAPKLRIPGFAWPLNAARDPFGGRAVYFARPARLGDNGGGFVGITSCNPGGGGQSCFTSSALTGFDAADHSPQFNAVATELQTVFPAESLFDAGTVVLPSGGAHTVVQPVQLPDRPLKELWAFNAGAIAHRAALLPSSADEEWCFTKPIGPCEDQAGGFADRDANPVAVNMVKGWFDANTAMGNKLVFADLRENVSDVSSPLQLQTIERAGETALAWGSHCVRDELGVQHRLLEFWVVDPDAGTGRTVLVDMGRGISDVNQVGANYLADNRRVNEYNDMIYLSRTEDDAGAPLLLALSVLGYSFQVEVYRVSSAGPILRLERVLLGGMPLSIERFTSGNLVAPGSRDTLLMFPTHSDGGESYRWSTGIFVGLLSNTWSEDGDPLFGGYGFNARHDLTNSNVYVGGIDNYDRDVMFLLMKRAADTAESSAPWRVDFSVLRFGEWSASP